MSTRERPSDRGRRRGIQLVRDLGREIRDARIDRSLSLADVGGAVGLSGAAISRIERGLTPGVPVVRLASLCEIVGLELAARAYPGGQPLRDAGHARLIDELRRRIHPTLRWSIEVPLPGVGDQRSWDAMIAGRDWRYGVEAETAPRDFQALARRIELKRRDGEVDGVILLLRSSRRTAAFLAGAGDLLFLNFPIGARQAMSRLSEGEDPGGSAIVVLPAVRASGFASAGR